MKSLVSSVSLFLILLLRLEKAAASPNHLENEQLVAASQSDSPVALENTSISPLTSASASPDSYISLSDYHALDHHLPNFHLPPSPEEEAGDEDGRPRKSSFHSHMAPKKALHVSFGWVQFDDRWMPSEDMEDTAENREHIRELMLTDARHGNLEYFVYLVNVLGKFGSSPEAKASSATGYELAVNNPNSLVVAAVHSDNVELFIEVMNFKGITIADLNPCKVKSPNPIKAGGSSYPPRRKSFFGSDSSSDDGTEGDEHIVCVKIEDTIFGQAILYNSIGILGFLLDQGIRDEYPEKTTTALHYAIQCHHELVIRLLLARGGSQVDRFNGGFYTPLMKAVLTGVPKLVHAILEHRPDLFITNFNRCNVLHLAAKVGNFEILGMIKVAADELAMTTKYGYNEFAFGRDLKRNSILSYAASPMVYEYLVKEFGLKER